MKFYAMHCLAVCLLGLSGSSLAAGDQRVARPLSLLAPMSAGDQRVARPLSLLAPMSAGDQRVARPLSLLAPMSAVTDFEVDLRSGQYSSPLPAGVAWQSPLTSNIHTCTCDRQGVLKLTFSKGSRVRAEINMTFEDSKGWTFNVGDSISNNGYAGDWIDQDNNAEVHSIGNNIYFFGKNKVLGVSWGLLLMRKQFVATQPYTTVSLNIGDERATADNGLQFLLVDSYKMFALNGQSDSARGGVNYDVYLGMNRVVDGAYRKGSGLCKVRVKFYPS